MTELNKKKQATSADFGKAMEALHIEHGKVVELQKNQTAFNSGFTKSLLELKGCVEDLNNRVERVVQPGESLFRKMNTVALWNLINTVAVVILGIIILI